MLIIDEISFAAEHDFEKLDRNLRILRNEKQLKYGRTNIIFAGDLRQLEPIGGSKGSTMPIYHSDFPQFHEWVNCYVELNGTHRFNGDPEWVRLLSRFRMGRPGIADIKKINEQFFSPGTVLPEGVQVACFANQNRDAVGKAIFEK